MTFLEKLQVIQRLDGLIRRKATGSAEELAQRLGISRRCVYDILAVMKNLNAPIEYCSIRKSYIYTYDCDLNIGYVPSEHLKGGKSQTFFNDFYAVQNFCTSHKYL